MARPRVETWIQDPELLVMRQEVRRAENLARMYPDSVKVQERYLDRLSIYRAMLTEHVAKRRA